MTDTCLFPFDLSCELWTAVSISFLLNFCTQMYARNLYINMPQTSMLVPTENLWFSMLSQYFQKETIAEEPGNVDEQIAWCRWSHLHHRVPDSRTLKFTCLQTGFDFSGMTSFQWIRFLVADNFYSVKLFLWRKILNLFSLILAPWVSITETEGEGGREGDPPPTDSLSQGPRWVGSSWSQKLGTS